MTDYPPNMTLRPLQQWPHAETKKRRRSNFSAGWSSTLKLLTTELHMLSRHGGRTAPSVLQIALREQDFRNDGLPRASSVPTMPGVILNIEANVGPLSYPCDAFDRWQDNLRAIALGLEALRKIGRYGITPGNEQYTGWKALPEKGAAEQFTPDSAEEFLRSLSAGQGNGLDLGTLPQIYRRARGKAHPDLNNGERALWDKVEAAAAVLQAAGSLP
jgi:hypothetical protein